jgi:hypothetical protein
LIDDTISNQSYISKEPNQDKAHHYDDIIVKKNCAISPLMAMVQHAQDYINQEMQQQWQKSTRKAKDKFPIKVRYS